MDKNNCDTCYQIKCKSCGWIPNDDEVKAVQSGVLTKCPVCGWRP